MVYIIGDTHGDNSYIYNIQHKKNLTKDDYIIVCGDFGFVWNGDYKRQLYKLHKCTEATILFVDGNHESFDLLEKFPVVEWHGGKASQLTERIFWLRRGEIYTIEGHTYFCFGGARSVDKEWRTPGKSWWPQEEPTIQEMIHGMEVINENLDKIEYVITHDCPSYVIKMIDSYKCSLPIENGYKLRLYFDNYFERLFYDSKSFKHWYCGHHHTNKDLDDLKFSFLYHKFKKIEEERK